ncbi:MAG: hypothetical protein HC851_19885 [Acaryochloris sp. RU_4_1]|nr:hypothetical protein [Acaryochloris sp. RU_4_1]NJR56497.1 hypothetical protein [Acaryochloris sp. CRU_2_0]
MQKVIPLALALTAVPAIVQAQTSDPIIEISANHGHIFTLENSQARIVKAWPGAFEAFDFGEYPNIPNAKFIFVKLKAGAKLDSTTLTLIIDEGGKETTKNYILKRIKGIPTQTATLIGNQPIVAAKPEPVTITQPFTPPSSIPAPQVKQEGEKPEKLKVSKEFSAFSGGAASKVVVAKSEKPKEFVQPKSDRKEKDTLKAENTEQIEQKAKQLSSKSLPLTRPHKAPTTQAKVEREKELIERSSLDGYAIANYLLKGLYRAERLKQINYGKPSFGQAQSTARLLRQGHTIQQSLKRTGLPPVTFDNLLGHGGVGK